MIRQRVVLIVGAGCSVPYGFPDGQTLVSQIIAGTAHGGRLRKLLKTCGNDDRGLDGFHADLERARPASIDRFLVARPEYAIMGKQAIVAHLMRHEEPAKLIPEHADSDWLHYLQSRILVRPTVEEVADNNVTFVTFNFDRLIEASLYNWLRGMYAPTPQQAAEVVNKFQVIHIHGSLGHPSWLGASRGRIARRYEPDTFDGERLAEIATHLHIIGDGVRDEPASLVRDALHAADEVVFLGFGFDPVNLDWLNSCGLQRESLKRSGTMYGMTNAEVRHAVSAGISFPDSSWDARTFIREHAVFHER